MNAKHNPRSATNLGQGFARVPPKRNGGPPREPADVNIMDNHATACLP